MNQNLEITAACPDCGNRFTRNSFMGYALQKYCPPCGEKRAASFEADRLVARAQSLAFMRREFKENPDWGIPQRYWANTWEHFRFDQGGESNRSVVEKLQQYAQEFPVTAPAAGTESVVLASPNNGVGKTMLAGLMLADIIGRFDQHREKCPFQFWSAGRIRQRLATAERFGSSETVEDVYRDLSSVWLLILDDVGKEHADGRAGAQLYEMYFNILDARYNRNLPIVITSNLGPTPWEPGGLSLVDLMGRASVSRLSEMTGRVFHRIAGEDRR